VLLAGGSGQLQGGLPEAELLATQLEAWGIERSRILVDKESRNTHENALQAMRIVREHGLGSAVLVTSASHMKRALGCFAKAGLPVDTLPVDFRAYAPGHGHGTWLPSSDALAMSTHAIHELVGGLVYRLVGYV
jgi:uncharacterized SAM-binding protein YcdF (DUF218 family)